jgi:hypothetical protein
MNLSQRNSIRRLKATGIAGRGLSSIPDSQSAPRESVSGDARSQEKAMKRARQDQISPETLLGILAMRFRSTRDEGERDAITQEYAAVVSRLVESGKWETMPTFESQLPDERLPKAFFDYWGIPCPHEQNGIGRQPK